MHVWVCYYCGLMFKCAIKPLCISWDLNIRSVSLRDANAPLFHKQFCFDRKNKKIKSPHTHRNHYRTPTTIVALLHHCLSLSHLFLTCCSVLHFISRVCVLVNNLSCIIKANIKLIKLGFVTSSKSKQDFFNNPPKIWLPPFKATSLMTVYTLTTYNTNVHTASSLDFCISLNVFSLKVDDYIAKTINEMHSHVITIKIAVTNVPQFEKATLLPGSWLLWCAIVSSSSFLLPLAIVYKLLKKMASY